MQRVLIPILVPASAALALAPCTAFAQTPSDVDRYAYGPGMMVGRRRVGDDFRPVVHDLLSCGADRCGGPFRSLGGRAVAGDGDTSTNVAGSQPFDILKERFARGEIDKDEFEERRRVFGE
ncbi:SHOCT domain-containing protein [Mesorhizobium sp. VK24D]|uniref:SHOCT domain-containing protein n=1 Tax=Mesorhizobium album TaxID=3072314 RepID=A0ABU4Y3Y5_9HYPH|nr:SHOCT domain-containing protein [Mesorhizobium sp. VK24D]MDX8481645.1 SHOCT domain-containing protein [Mesorhizobium sp. VK24D]